MKPVEPIIIVDLFLEERDALLTLLLNLTDTQWQMPTICDGWSVKDIALHLFGDDVGLLNRTPEFKFPVSAGLESWDALVQFINTSNQQWVEVNRRISANLLCELLGLTGHKVHQRIQSLDMFALGEPVSWAGPEPAPIWLDVAREYTERWMHQQQIRDALDAPPLTNVHFFAPVLDTFVRALPHTYRNLSPETKTGTSVLLEITGAAGDKWILRRDDGGWNLYVADPSDPSEVITPNATVTLDQDVAWRVFTRGISQSEAEQKTRIDGDYTLGHRVLDAVAIIA